MAKCRDYKERHDCPYFHKVTEPDEQVQVGTSMKKLDREAKLDRLDNRGRRSAAQQAAYYEANREKIAAQQAAYREANREKYNAYMREYLRKRREAKKAASDGANIESGKPIYDGAILAHGKGIFNERNQNQSADP